MMRGRIANCPSFKFQSEPSCGSRKHEIEQPLDEAEKVSMLVVEQNASPALDRAGRAHLIETGRSGTADHLRNDENVLRAYLGY
jgi:branched-chain amino acid transport system ATP-binding protein